MKSNLQQHNFMIIEMFAFRKTQSSLALFNAMECVAQTLAIIRISNNFRLQLLSFVSVFSRSLWEYAENMGAHNEKQAMPRCQKQNHIKRRKLKILVTFIFGVHFIKRVLYFSTFRRFFLSFSSFQRFSLHSISIFIFYFIV